MRVIFIEELREPAPADVIGKKTLLIGVREPVFILQLVKKLDRLYIVIEPFERSTDSDIVFLDPEVRPVV